MSDDTRAALEASDGLIRQAQSILETYLNSGRDAKDAIDDLLGLLDGPEQRRIQEAARAALENTGPLPLGNVLDRLYASELNFSISSFWDNNIDLRLGDTMNGFDAETNVATAGEAAEWLDREARRVYPTSKYATAKDPIGEAGNGQR